jgi:hypothetical protein
MGEVFVMIGENMGEDWETNIFKRGVSNDELDSEKRNGRSDVDKAIEIHDIL